ncbi:unnamed protein product [Peronospora destructor]|uniref:CCHC-type domain-containing protein n=1 Tax=Peronospora destructor TaxID=86335 RepID=A0AAV0V6Y5_9STRA|nr:unnamed protein product [Peronospora destructor]
MSPKDDFGGAAHQTAPAVVADGQDMTDHNLEEKSAVPVAALDKIFALLGDLSERMRRMESSQTGQDDRQRKDSAELSIFGSALGAVRGMSLQALEHTPSPEHEIIHCDKVVAAQLDRTLFVPDGWPITYDRLKLAQFAQSTKLDVRVKHFGRIVVNIVEPTTEARKSNNVKKRPENQGSQKCYLCGNTGHLKSNCPKKAKKQDADFVLVVNDGPSS